MWDRFDMRLLLTCDRYADRLPSVRAELSRVGLEVRELRSGFIPGLVGGRVPLGLQIAHMSAYREFLCSGCSTMLIVEDDVRFLKDTELVRSLVDRLPQDFDEARFCWGGARGDALRARAPWARVGKNAATCYMTACYALSRRAAGACLAFAEDVLAERLPPLCQDLRIPWYPRDFRVYVSVPPAATVASVAGASGASARGALIADAVACGMSPGDYMD